MLNNNKKLNSNYVTGILDAECFSVLKVYDKPDEQKKQILLENKGKSGVYRWTNKITAKSYVGSASNLSKRLYFYYSQNLIRSELTRGNSAIYSAILKHGLQNFRLEVIEYCERADTIEREQYYIDLLQPEYNILKTAGSRLGSKHSDETKVKIGASCLGKTHSEEARQLMSVAKKGKNKSEGTGSPSQKIEVFDNITNLTTTYESILEAARTLNIRHSTISNYFARNQLKPFKGRYVFAKISPVTGV